MSDTKYCKDCKNINCPEGRVNCKYLDAIACAFYRDTQPTLFDRITASPDVLVEKLVYDWGHLCHNGDVKIYWKSTILPDAVFYSKSEAIAATLEELNKVSK